MPRWILLFAVLLAALPCQSQERPEYGMRTGGQREFAGRSGQEGDSAVFRGFRLSDLEPELSGDEEAAGGVFLARCPFLVCVSERGRTARAGARAPVCLRRWR